MKNKKALKLLLVIALVFTLSSYYVEVQAVSEVSGNLSSGVNNGDSISSGPLSGSVSDTSGGGSGGGSSGRRVTRNSTSDSSSNGSNVDTLSGVNQVAVSGNSNPVPNSFGGNSFSSSGSGVSSPEEVAVVDLGEGMEISDESSDQIAQAFAPIEGAGIGVGTWLLILLLVLLLIAIVSYIYNRTLDERTTKRLP